jgi:uncharacterized protein (TIGR02300 family)
MSTKAERGTKRTCQNPECGSRFYDLNRDPVTCPICQTVYQLAMGPATAGGGAAAAVAEEKVARKPAKKPAYVVVDDAAAKPEDAPVAEGEDALPALEGEEEPAATEDDETFLEEEEEDGSDMSNIIGGPVAEPDEPQ